MSLSNCSSAFILAVLCGSPTLKASFKTFLNTMILQLDQEIALLTAQLGRLNVLNQFLSAELQTVQALVSNVAADMNLITEPFKQFPDCPDLAKIATLAQQNAVGKKIAGLQNKVYELTRVTNLVNLQNAIMKQKQQSRNDLQEFVDKITSLCP